MYVRFEIFTAATMKNAVFWDVAPCTSYVNRRSSEMSVYTRSIRHHIQEDDILQVECISAVLNSCVPSIL
jgi:hypothetical protein